MTTSTPPATPAPPRRHGRRLAIPLILLAALLVAGVVLFIRGTWASDTSLDPAGGEAGPVAQVYQPPGEGKRVRCAMRLPYPPDRVWAAVTDYDHYGDFLPYIKDVKAERKGGACQVTGQAQSLLGGYWPFTINVREKQDGGRRVAYWEEKGGSEVRLNRGSWEVIPSGDGQTLLVLSLEAEVHNYPTFILRNAFLHRLKGVLRNVERHVQETSADLK
jgi:hypothetical protein